MAKRALITGISGQDGSYLAELLIAKGYEVHGLVRDATASTPPMLAHLGSTDLHVHPGDLSDAACLERLIREVAPHETYNLAAQSHVGLSFELADYTNEVVAVGAARLLGAIRSAGLDCRYYQASSAEIFGPAGSPRTEQSPYNPRSPYATAKLYAHHATTYFREAYDQFAVCGIAFNHESPRRGASFATRKITLGVAAISSGAAQTLTMGNLSAVRDWGHAPEYVEAMWRMLQRDEPEDFVLATGKGRSVADFCRTAFAHAGLNWEDHVRYDSQHERPQEVDSLVGDPSKARELLGWKAEADGDDVARLMVEADLADVATPM